MKKPGSHQRATRSGAKRAFVPISIARYVSRHVARNPGVDPTDLRVRLRDALEAKLAGARCDCGQPIWALGSAEVGYRCFTCITGEAVPDNDYEVVSTE
jgi:hypothetical protein